MTNGKRRRVSLLILALCLLVIVAIGWQMWYSLRQSTVSYGVDIITPVEKTVCIGGVIRFPVDVTVPPDTLPNQAEIAESWCMAGITGPCWGVQPSVLKDGSKRLPLLKEKRIVGIAVRQVPPWVTPGLWEFWHTSVDIHGNIEAYSVEPVTVLDCK